MANNDKSPKSPARRMSSHNRAMQHTELWGNPVNYYEKDEIDEAKFDELTSPKYYEEHETLIKKMDAVELGNSPAEEEATYIVEELGAKPEELEKKKSRKEDEIEKRRANEKVRENILQNNKERKEKLAHQVESRRKELDDGLREQIDFITARDAAAGKLKSSQDVAFQKRIDAQNLRALWQREEKVREEKEIVLFNERTHKRKLEERSKQVKEDLRKEQKFLDKIHQANVLDRIDDENKKQELRRSVDEYNSLIIQLHELEDKRQSHIDQTFDLAAKSVYEQFDEPWRKEREMRQEKMREVLYEIEKQIEASVARNKRDQLMLIGDKAESMENARQHKEEMHLLKVEEEKRREEYQHELDEQMKDDRMQEQSLENLRKKTIDEESEQEEKIKKELVHLSADMNTHQNFGKKKSTY